MYVIECKATFSLSSQIPISGSKECFDEPKNLRKKIHEAMEKENQEQNSNTKDDDGDSVKKRDKV